MKMPTSPESAQDAGASYDETPYPSSSFPQTHPDKLAAMGRLFGLEAPLPATARVLELGCANGANLLPMAQHLPEARFLGIDASAKHVEEAQAAIAAAGLTNVEIRHQNILDFPSSEGKFDFITAHGVWSWVPVAVREKILTICREQLTENGVAYISYNTFPGWGMRMSLREMMLMHTRGMPGGTDRVRQARALAAFLAESAAGGKPYSLALNQELERMKSLSDNYLRHDILGDINQPIYFHEFAAQLAAAGLQYLSEPELDQMLAANFPQKVQDALTIQGASIIVQEQYMDFVRNRSFRQSLVAHRGAKLDRKVMPQKLAGMFFTSRIEAPILPVDFTAGTNTEFRILGSKLTTKVTDSFLKGAFSALAGARVHRISFEEVLAAARAAGPTSGAPRDSAAREDYEHGTLLQNLMQLYARGLISIFAGRPRLKREPGEKPVVSPLARYEALHAAQVTSRLHQPVQLDVVAREILACCDGSHDRAGIVDHLVKLTQEGKLQATEGEKPLVDEAAIRAAYLPRVDMALADLASYGFFAG